MEGEEFNFSGSDSDSFFDSDSFTDDSDVVYENHQLSQVSSSSTCQVCIWWHSVTPLVTNLILRQWGALGVWSSVLKALMILL